jgi:thiamine-phosphate diphosphorylase
MRGIYVITDQLLFPGRSHAQIARAAIEGGARILQLRDKDASDREFYECAVELRGITRAAGAMFFVNDRVAIAAAVGADGVNIGQTDMPVAAARRVLGPDVMIGLSSDSVEQAVQAESDGVDYVGFGPVFPTSTKLDAGPVSGLDTLAEVVRRVSIPVVAIGGIGLANIRSVAEAGAACAAVVSAVVCAGDMASATRVLVQTWETHSLTRMGMDVGG